jgi:hypothetical protein
VGSSEYLQKTAAQRSVRAQPPDDEGLSLEGELGAIWDYTYKGAMLRDRQRWIGQLRRARTFQI